MSSATADLVTRATGRRHGIVVPPRPIPVTAADPPCVHHASVAFEGRELQSAGGGVARNAASAAIAAVAEALERYAATYAALPLRRQSDLRATETIPLEAFSLHSMEQRSRPAFPHRDAYPADPWMTQCFDLTTNQDVWIPAALVSMTPDYGALATSSGLAADPDPTNALLRALQEIIERDAYMTTWMHQLGGRCTADGMLDERLGGRRRVFDITPAYSPHPVAAVTGTLGLAGEPRNSIGLACRQRWVDAVERAELEMLQGIVFVGHLLMRAPELRGIEPHDVTNFDEHAVFYSANPALWDELPLHRLAQEWTPPGDVPPASPAAQLSTLVAALETTGIRVVYRELTTPDLNQLGLHVVRVVSPDLTPIHHDHRFPFTGGRASDVHLRYPGLTAGSFPSPYPHALG